MPQWQLEMHGLKYISSLLVELERVFDVCPTVNYHLKTAIQMVILYSSETQATDVYFLAQDCQTSKGSVRDCIRATRECTWVMAGI